MKARTKTEDKKIGTELNQAQDLQIDGNIYEAHEKKTIEELSEEEKRSDLEDVEISRNS